VTAAPHDSVDERIAELWALHERIGQNLVELDADVTRQMLQSSTTLRGRTAAAWAEASAAIEDLWLGHMALADLLERVTHARGPRTWVPRAAQAQLTELLDGRSIAFPRPGSRPSLTETAAPTDQCTVQEAIVRMSSDYDRALALTSEVGAVWTVVVPRLEALEVVLDGLERAATASGTRRPNQLPMAREQLADALAVARDDPLALDEDVLDSLPAEVDRMAEFVHESQTFFQEVLAELAAIEAGVDAARHVLEDAERTTAEDAAKVLAPDERRRELGTARKMLDSVGEELDERRAQAGIDAAGARRHVADLLGRVTELEQLCARCAAGNVGTVFERDQLRGRLVAFRAKAHALGRSEDLDLDQLYRQASDALYRAPCDLDQARALVLSYQRALGPSKGGSS
jgi:hypothetical protein